MHLIEIVAYAVILMVIAISLGRFVLKPLRIETDDSALLIGSGLTPLLIGLYYTQETALAIPLLWLWFALSVAATLSTFKNRNVASNDSASEIQITPLITTVSLIGLIYAFLDGRDGPASLANNDLYSWYSVASTLIGKARYMEMSPTAAEAWPIFAHDGYGTNWMLALVGFFYRDPINSAPLFLVITSSWLALIFQWQLQKLFSLGPKSSLLLSISPFASAFYLYIAFNSFFAQLLGTIGGALLLSVVIRLHRNRNTPIVHATVLLLVPFLWCLYVYQSGFLAFQFISVGYAFFLFLLSKPYRDGIRHFFAKFLAPYSLTIVIAAITNPGLTLYLVNRTFTVSDVVAGWPLPLLPVDVFTGFPWPDLAAWLYGGGTGGQPVFYLCLAIGLLIFSHIHSRRNPNENTNAILALGFWYLILVSIYLYWFYSGKSSYQNWKFATFFIFSSTALPLGILALTARTVLSSQAHESHRPNRYRTVFAAIMAVMAIAAAMLMNLRATKTRLTKLGPSIEQLVQIREVLKKDTTVNLLLGDYGKSMLPMLLLSPKASIYPLAKTYLPPSTDIATGPDVINLVSAECSHVLHLISGQTASAAEIMRTRDYAVYSSTKNLGLAYRFNAGGERCTIEGGVTIDFGFADPEAWGQWSEGRNAQLSIDIPPSLRGKELELYLNVRPYIFGDQKEQRMSVEVNGKRNPPLSLHQSEMLTFTLDESVSGLGQVKLFFEFPDARKPAETDPGSTDQRTLAVGFIDLGLTERN